MDLLITITLFALGLGLLIKGSDAFIDGAASIARHYRVSEAVIGITLVSMGTSLPELASDTYASLRGNGLLAVSDIVGSNITNVALVLGLGIVAVERITIDSCMARRDGSIMLASLALFSVLSLGGLSCLEGFFLLACFASYLLYLFHDWRQKRDTWVEPPTPAGRIRSVGHAGALLVGGRLMVFLGSRLFVHQAVTLATLFGLSESVIGATLMAFGTSVPELAVTLGGLIKKHVDISVGNIIGSNIFNIMWVIGLSAVIRPLPVDDLLLLTHIPLMLLVSVLLVLFMNNRRGLLRWHGMSFLIIYALFIGLSYF